MGRIVWKIISCLILSFGIVFGQIKNPSTGIDKTITRGDHSVLTWQIQDSLVNHDLLFVVKASKTPAANRLIQKGNYSAYSGLTTSYSGGVTTITDTIYTTETNNWQSGNYFYDIWNDTDSATIVSGLFTVNSDVGTPFDGLDPSSLNIYTAALDTPTANPSFIIGYDSTNAWEAYNIPSDSSGLTTGQLYYRAGDGIIRRKY